jgi:hypothetical protein
MPLPVVDELFPVPQHREFSSQVSQTTEFADFFWAVFRVNQRIPEEYAVVSLLRGA